ncbi:hypothetical protein GGX14DRAFT_349997 [Mycena pura]|uniref:Uncharacterized protein n=1 Tax=Mycena pura TaxID=153505 RepID=A0AAD6YPH3_9AGAR|nr:hypothetical protein GGX14DRAFT_349997 [Mycena pura]
MSPAIIVQYTLHPPATSGQVFELPLAKKHIFELGELSSEALQPEYYKMLRQSIARARDEVGQELTAWRDVVGKAEQGKDAKKYAKTEEDEEEEEDGDA